MSPKFLWREAVGPEGARVWAIERTPGRFYLGHYEKGRNGLRLKAIDVADQRAALAEALAFSRALTLAGELDATGVLTLGALLARYTQEVSAHKTPPQPKEDERRAAIWLAFLGAETDVRTINKQDLKRFERARAAGTLDVKVWRTVKGTRQLVALALKPNPSGSTIGADIIYLQSVLNWAVEAEILDRNRTAKYKDRPKSETPKQPVVTYDRFLKVREKADEAHPRFGAFMDIIEALGWRLSAIRRLKGADIDRTVTAHAPHGRIYKQPRHDKKRKGGWVPMPEAVRRAADALGVVGDAWLFPSQTDPTKPWGRSYARDLLERAETLAGLTPIEGGDFHPYRRKWATERKHHPVQDVMEAGAWSDRRSLETAYQQADPETVARVVLDTTKLRDADTAGGASGTSGS